MPAKSKRQAGFLGMVASGKISRKGLSRSRAREMLRGSKVKHLPTRARSRKR